MRFLIGCATAIMIFGVVFAQAPTMNHVPDLVIWAIATVLLVPAIIKAWQECTTSDTALKWLFIAAGELLFCGYAISVFVRHLHSL